MSYEIRCAAEGEFEEWNRYVSRSQQAGPFHRREAIKILAEQTGTRLHPLMGLKGEQVIGLLPLFSENRGPFELVLSPPLQTVLNLGPVLLDTDQLKQRKLERRNWRFINGCLEWIDDRFDADYVDIRTSERYGDLRPFKRRDYTVEPFYTHVVDISEEPDQLLQRISRDPRSSIRNTEETAYEIAVGDRDDATWIVEQVRKRHGDDLEGKELDVEFTVLLHDEFPDGQVRPYVCYDEHGSPVGGKITVESDGTIVFFKGGAKNNSDLPVNELLDWHIITDAHDRGLARYDLTGANKFELSQYKSKFAPTLVPYYKIRRTSPEARVALAARERLKPLLRRV